ncbi:sugar ABC transporter ATP-binding protein [uncultured Jatrophihabitans sp.]|uniref:sugar ABC transporter ATP-binding protein n=1 Tax=uncultured Jatrophihabitans sp. TaxID=1610747 RepID=UPI0035CC7AFD
MADDAAVPALEVRSLSKTFGANRALRDVSLTIPAGEVHCLVGENGSGKSTLIKILSAYHTPDAGSRITVGGRRFEYSPGSAHNLGCRFVHQDLGLILERSVLDNVFLGTGYPTRAGTIRRQASYELAKADLRRLNLNVDPNAPMATLSAAERTGVAIARALRDDAGVIRLLVLDEPTATLPIDDVSNLLDLIRRIANSGVSVLYVTHRLDEIFAIGDRVSVLRDGRLVMTAPVGKVTRDGIVTSLTGHAPLQDVLESTGDPRERQHEPVMVVDGLTASTLSNVSFAAYPTEILGVAGITGSGRETLLSTIFGARPRSGGRVAVGGQPLRPDRPDLSIAAGIAYLPVDRTAHGSIPGLSGRENLVLTDVRRHWNHLAISRRREQADVREWFARLDVRPRLASEQPLSAFSGGNQQKILFGKWLRRRPSVFLLDEPTQGVDIRARERLHDLLRAASAGGMAVVISSTDVNELSSVCDRVLIMSDGQIVNEIQGPIIDDKFLSRAILTASRKESQVHA